MVCLDSSMPLAISCWSLTEPPSALGLMVRANALSASPAEAVALGLERGACRWSCWS